MTRIGLSGRAFELALVLGFLAGCGGSASIATNGAMPNLSTYRGGQSATAEQVLYRFRDISDGRYPGSALTDVNGTLYGTTQYGGGSPGAGTAFSIDTTGTKKTLHRFGRGNDGAGPGSGFIVVNGALYGTTGGGGLYNAGTVYRLSTAGKEKVIYSFPGGAEGASPTGSVVNIKGMLYGTTLYGGSGCGSAGCGVVYSVSTAGVEKVLYSLKGGGDGSEPNSGLISVKNVLYGIASLGGNIGCAYHSGCGTVFSVTRSGKEKTLYRFKGDSDGGEPLAGLVNMNGTLYGTTGFYGEYGGGTAYSLTTHGAEKVLHQFGNGSDASQPQAPLIVVGDSLYGTTWSGGSSDAGAIFRITKNRSEKVVYSFGETGKSDGSSPSAALLDVSGTMYGSTAYGGDTSKGCKGGCGTVFSFTP